MLGEVDEDEVAAGEMARGELVGGEGQVGALPVVGDL